MSHRGSLLCLPDGIWAWPVANADALTEDALALVFARFGSAGFFYPRHRQRALDLAGALRARFRDAHISLDTMTTGPAVRTYNVMLMESRRVGAGLIAVD